MNLSKIFKWQKHHVEKLPEIRKPNEPNIAIIKPIAAALPIALLIGYPKNFNIGTFITAPPIPIGAEIKPVIMPEIILADSPILIFISVSFSFKKIK
jgi:hypothetical protein